jgi:enamine deaminase RidA (YjgF/YER057c/UK114 family)
MASPEENLQALGVQLLAPSRPAANYVNAVRTGNLLFLSGVGPQRPDGSFVTGKVGATLTADEAYEAARLTGLVMLANIRAELGSLDKVARCVKVLGMVNADPGFSNTPAVINGFSDLFVAVFGEAGRAARSAVGMASLPFQIAVEVEMVVEIAD